MTPSPPFSMIMYGILNSQRLIQSSWLKECLWLGLFWQTVYTYTRMGCLWQASLFWKKREPPLVLCQFPISDHQVFVFRILWQLSIAFVLLLWSILIRSLLALLSEKNKTPSPALELRACEDLNLQSHSLTTVAGCESLNFLFYHKTRFLVSFKSNFLHSRSH